MARKRTLALTGAALGLGAIVLTGTACTVPFGLPVGLHPPSSSQASMLYKLRQCETGGNYRMHVWQGSIEYAGAYGFNVRYWRANGYRPDPQFASPALQDAVILRYIAQLGIRNSNPGCAAKLGLR